jgi:hypothetical protein
MAAARNPYIKALFLAVAFLAVILSQHAYDAVKTAPPAISSGSPASSELVRVVDMGFHSTVASALWIATMPEALDFFHGKTEYLSDLDYLNSVDPRLGYPYAFSVLILPALPYNDSTEAWIEIGTRGIKNADPDWQIPYYMATNYFLSLHDRKSAIEYYDIAARTPGIPAYAERFALNFGIGENERAKVKELWTTIRDTTNDDFTKTRAEAYIERLDDLDLLEAAASTYKTRFGSYPTSTDALVNAGIISALPQDPFGFTFVVSPKTGVAGIDLNTLPSYLSTNPQD